MRSTPSRPRSRVVSDSLARGALAALAVLVLANCSGPSPLEVLETAVPDMVGENLASVERLEIPDDAVVIVQDASPRVGLEPTYDESQWGSSQWFVVAACTSPKSAEQAASIGIQVAVIPVKAVDETVRVGVAEGTWGDAVDCS